MVGLFLTVRIHQSFREPLNNKRLLENVVEEERDNKMWSNQTLAKARTWRRSFGNGLRNFADIITGEPEYLSKHKSTSSHLPHLSAGANTLSAL